MSRGIFTLPVPPNFPIAILSLQRLRELQADGIAVDMDTPFRIKDPQTAAIVAARDSTHPQQQLTVSHLNQKNIFGQ